ncbi:MULTISPECIES: class I SAM-dependent methyltransferase [Bacillus]|uniref:class I SAM-dependent methyltransferase n=1 Tax=Bacillus TaxID=1386 RepID=UPI000401FEA0|nr:MULTISPECIES: class I SAM-dependent methyltransferase [Bacillus]QHZ47842.1 class I SAM-dependent methyltransferase [Bacillus sp. NSP9.1]WFA03925.1 class I SAM-dependent methyltransferase [Bacillus sp. HSf4]
MFEQWLGKRLRSPWGMFSKWTASYMNHDINEWVIQLLDVRPHERILQIGTGSGAVLCRVAEKLESGTACGVDPAKRMVKQSLRRTRHLRKEGRAEVKVGHAEHIPFADRSFHKVFSIHAMDGGTDIQQALKEFYRVLQVDGTVFFTVHLNGQTKHSRQAKGDTLYTEQQIKRLLEESHFRDITVHMRDKDCCITAVK